MIGKDDSDRRLMFERFMARKNQAESRVRSLRGVVMEQQRMNRALRVGRVPEIVVKLLNEIQKAGFAENLTTVGTHALFAYEASCGVRIQPAALTTHATRDVDPVFDARRHIEFFARMQTTDSSLIGVLRRADSTFEVMDDQKQTAVNAKGFEVDVIRRQGSRR